jgi:molybdopterin-guanine dinucleotide biosynthesis protein A
MPLINRSLVEFLIDRIEGEDVIIPRTVDGLQPLHAFLFEELLERHERDDRSGQIQDS